MNEYNSYISKLNTFNIWYYKYEFGKDKEVAIIKTEDEYRVFNIITGKELIKNRKIREIKIYRTFVAIEFKQSTFYDRQLLHSCTLFSNVIILTEKGKEAIGYAETLYYEPTKFDIHNFTNYHTINKRDITASKNIEHLIEKMPKYEVTAFLKIFEDSGK